MFGVIFDISKGFLMKFRICKWILTDFRHFGRIFRMFGNFLRIFEGFSAYWEKISGFENEFSKDFQDISFGNLATLYLKMNFYKDFRDILRIFSNSK